MNDRKTETTNSTRTAFRSLAPVRRAIEASIPPMSPIIADVKTSITSIYTGTTTAKRAPLFRDSKPVPAKEEPIKSPHEAPTPTN